MVISKLFFWKRKTILQGIKTKSTFSSVLSIGIENLLNYYLLNNIMFYLLPYDDFSIRRASFGRYLYRYKSMLSCHMRLCRFINIYLAKLRAGGTTQNSLLDTTINFTYHYIIILMF